MNSGQFKPGQSGNPKGAPVKEMRFHERLKSVLSEKIKTDTREGYEAELDRLDTIARNLVTLAEQSALPAIIEIADRLDGKSHQSTDITSGGEKLQVIPILGNLEVHDEPK